MSSDDPQHFRHAEQARKIAESIADPGARATVLRAAETLERLATQAEARALHSSEPGER